MSYYILNRLGQVWIEDEALLRQLEDDDVGELWLGTATDNPAGQALFTSTGACKSGETFNDFIYELP